MSTPSHLYRAFGLTIGSDVAITELTPAAAGAVPDIVVRKQPLGRTLPGEGTPPVFDYGDARGVVMIWPGVAAFRLVGSHTVEVEPYPGASEQFLAFPLLGPVMAWMLDRKGFFVLHSSAVAIDGKSVCFLGDKMAGKSTIAAAFVRQGAGLVTDDLLALDMTDPQAPSIAPAFAQLKLTDQSAAAIPLRGAQALPFVVEGFPKRQHKLASMHDMPIRAGLIAVLNRGPTKPGVVPMATDEAIGALLRYSYNIRFGNAPPEFADRGRQFRACVALAKACTIARLDLPADLDGLDGVVAEVRRYQADRTTDA